MLRLPQFPSFLLHAAMQTYVGARCLSAESMVSQPIFAKNSILAGCPIAPALAKFIMGPMVTIFVDKIKPWMTDVWVDDVSEDLAATSNRNLQGWSCIFSVFFAKSLLNTGLNSPLPRLPCWCRKMKFFVQLDSRGVMGTPQYMIL